MQCCQAYFPNDFCFSLHQQLLTYLLCYSVFALALGSAWQEGKQIREDARQMTSWLDMFQFLDHSATFGKKQTNICSSTICQNISSGASAFDLPAVTMLTGLLLYISTKVLSKCMLIPLMSPTLALVL